MKNKSRNLLVLFNKKLISKQEADCLHAILFITESPELFCQAHELVDRNRITSKKRKILKECSRMQLRAFRFLINKN
jgi:predicted RNA binding protein with dsRBD fold (UPF0201 family)